MMFSGSWPQFWAWLSSFPFAVGIPGDGSSGNVWGLGLGSMRPTHPKHLIMVSSPTCCSSFLFHLFWGYQIYRVLRMLYTRRLWKDAEKWLPMNLQRLGILQVDSLHESRLMTMSTMIWFYRDVKTRKKHNSRPLSCPPSTKQSRSHDFITTLKICTSEIA